MGALNHTMLAVHGAEAGFSFAGAGFLIWYYIGIVEALSRLHVIVPSTKLAGASSGALIAASHCAGLPSAQIYDVGHKLAHACRNKRSCSGTLDRELRQVLQETLPADAFERCRNKGYIAITTGQLLLNNHHPLLVSDFHNNSDLISAAACSSFIPLWSAAAIATHYRGMSVYDGGFASQQPCPPDVKPCIRVSTSNPAWPRRSTVQSFMARAALRGPAVFTQPADTHVRHYPPIKPTSSDGPDPALLQLAASKNVDIAPGIYHQVPFSQEDWNNWALSPADDGTLHYMYELVKADAAAWAQHRAQQKQHNAGGKAAGH